jgi:hypothetical protein
MVDLNVITTVLRKFLANPRSPKYLNNPKYKEIYLSSAWYRHHWSWERAKSYFEAMKQGKKYFICSLPYQLSIKEGLRIKEEVLDEMSESDFNEIAWSMEMEALFYGESEKAYFKIKEMQNCRSAKNALYPPSSIEFISKGGRGKKKLKTINKQPNEIRLLGVDIALESTI